MSHPTVGQTATYTDLPELPIYNVINSDAFNIVVVWAGTAAMFGVMGLVWWLWRSMLRPWLEGIGAGEGEEEEEESE